MNDNSGSESQYEEPPPERDELGEVEKLTEKESNRVYLWHKLVIAVMVATAVAVPITAYRLLFEENRDDYETAIGLFSDSIRDSAMLNVKSIIGAATTFSGTISSYANAMNATWPFVTVPNFEMQVINTKKTTKAERILFLPLVGEKDYDKWNQFVQDEIGWREESMQTLGRSEITSGPVEDMYIVTNWTSMDWTSMTTSPANKEKKAPYSPYWQSSPPQGTYLINQDTYGYFRNRWYANSMEATRKIVFGRMFPVHQYVGDGLDYSVQTHDNLHEDFTSYEPDGATRSAGWASEVPHTTLLCPVFETENDIQSKIVAKFSYILPWDAFLTNLLPKDTKDIVAVLTNTNNQTATFIIRGNNALFDGWEDKHDERYDGEGVPIDFTGLGGINAKDYSDVANSGALLYNLTIYPTRDFENAYKNKTPMIFASAIAVAFFFMTLTFFTYDAIVHFRNKKVVRTAAKSNAIVASLFPSNVRDRLFEEKDQEIGVKASDMQRSKKRFSMLEGVEIPGVERRQGNETVLEAKPIADHFKNTTVMFGDLVGFTSWSSTRDPAAVFTLLETIYNAFDKLASRRGVFKVETIGDCYMAVVGVPEPRQDHAIVMARFSRDCLRKMRELAMQLKATLGPGTEDLTMRIGLHSGSVTAGVLRGARSRFQLFGDTVNTAARCETTGQPGRVHMSLATAELLEAAGKRHWCEKRDTLVSAKGKGEMQTFWLVEHSATGSLDGSSDHLLNTVSEEDDDDDDRNSDKDTTTTPADGENESGSAQDKGFVDSISDFSPNGTFDQGVDPHMNADIIPEETFDPLTSKMSVVEEGDIIQDETLGSIGNKTSEVVEEGDFVSSKSDDETTSDPSQEGRVVQKEASFDPLKNETSDAQESDGILDTIDSSKSDDETPDPVQEDCVVQKEAPFDPLKNETSAVQESDDILDTINTESTNTETSGGNNSDRNGNPGSNELSGAGGLVNGPCE